MSKITKSDVEHVAKLSRIELKEDELTKFTSEFEVILEYIGKLDVADTSEVDEIGQISGLENITRDDSIEPSLPTEEALVNAPDRQDNFFKVKKVIER